MTSQTLLAAVLVGALALAGPAVAQNLSLIHI